MSDYLNIFNLNRQKVAVLDNAHNVVEGEQLNAVGTLSFDLPINDTKTSYCQPFYYARYGDGQMYRILKPKRKRDTIGTYSYACEHVIATLIDDVIFGSAVVGGLGTYTRDVINYILSRQSVRRWVLGECDFSRQFEYGWENENLLSALFSVPNRFTEPYMWRFDTSTYPWRISLKKIDVTANPQFYVRAAKNLLVSETDMDYANICTRLYLLGYGEGINQLTVSEVNNGLPYSQSDRATVNKYGGTPISRILVDRRYEDAQSLLEYGRAQLAALQEPLLSNRVTAADLYKLTKADYDKAEVGRIIMLVEDNTKTYITGIRRNLDKVGDMALTIANKPTDIAGTIADLADRQRIESVYSQGATQLYAQSVQANATAAIGAVIRFFIPDDMRIVNFVKAKITLNRFRSYSRATKGGGGTTRTSSAGGGQSTTSGSGGQSSQTSSSGGGSSATSGSGGASTQTSSAGGGSSVASGASSRSTSERGLIINQILTGRSAAGGENVNTGTKNSHYHTYLRPPYRDGNYGWHQHYIYYDLSHTHSMSHTHSVSVPAHTHSVSVPSHSHSVSIPAHTHSVSIPSHSHSVTIRDHTHTIEIPNHTHDIEQGIFEFGSPTSASIYVNGTLKGSMEKNAELDISQYLTNDQNKIPRGSWLTVEVRPDDLAYITIDLVIKGFCQSRGGSTY